MAHKSDSIAVLKKDRFLAPHIKKHGVIGPAWGRATRSGIFHALLRSIVYQQISGKAAASILARVEALYPRRKPTPALVAKTPERMLRAAGLSSQKVAYVKDLARKFLDGSVRPHRIYRMTSEEVIRHLTQVKGVGVWTVHMLLIFTLRRPDILPFDDLGIRKGFQLVYGLRALPTRAQMERLAKPWRAHATTASLYLWRIADGRISATTTKKER